MSSKNKITKRITNYANKDSVGSKLRAKRILPLLDLIKEISLHNNTVKIIDIGGTEKYWNIIPRKYIKDYNISITIVNLPGTCIQKDHGPFCFVEGDGCNLAKFSDNSFHIAHSNSVIEHVGDWSRMVRFSQELMRVSQKYFVQTPNYWFPIEPHCMTPFFHWLPKPIQIWLVQHFHLGNWGKAKSISDAIRMVDRIYLLNKGMMEELFNDADIVIERFFFFPKSLIAIKK